MTNLSGEVRWNFRGNAFRAVLALVVAAFAVRGATAQTMGYVTNANGNSVSVIDVATNSVV
ncbi:MAG TPA: hypothetical protein VFO89_01875, partial [Thermoanaerobaculia bacterium]|nr:hypothetical protein [Thermoanaerobaculia bacterium]